MKGLFSVKKILLAFVIIVIFISNVKAQIRDSVLVYLNKDEQPIENKVGAASIRKIIHTDSTFSSGQKVAIIKDYYMSGNLKSVSQSYFDISKGFTPIFNGTQSDFFENGHLKQISKYVDGVQSDVVTRYYPDGKFYCDFKVDSKQRMRLMNCNDTTGNKICINGNGRWIKYVDDGFKSKSEGFVKNGYEDGDWKGNDGDSVKYTCTYTSGKIIIGNGYDRQGNVHPFKELHTDALLNGMSLSQFISHNLRYPKQSKAQNIQGKVFVSCVIEEDGRLANFKILRSPNTEMSDEVNRIFNPSVKYQPIVLYGIPRRTPLLFPVQFVLN